MRRVAPILLVLVTLVPQAALAGQWYRCRADLKVREVCCCGQDAHAGEAPASETRADRAPCCDVLENAPAAMRARTEPAADHPVPLAPCAPPPAGSAIGATAPLGQVLAVGAAAPPGRLSPLYLRHVSFLL